MQFTWEMFALAKLPAKSIQSIWCSRLVSELSPVFSPLVSAIRADLLGDVFSAPPAAGFRVDLPTLVPFFVYL